MDQDTDARILPPHIEATVAAIAKMHADHRQDAGFMQRLVEQTTPQIGRPRFIAGLTLCIVAWIGCNLAAAAYGHAPPDAPPFAWLQGVISLLALYVAILILTTQRRDDQLASLREQLTLELAILGEQKCAKIIALLEEMRRDSPTLKNRVDAEAVAMSVAADPEAVLGAIRDSQDVEVTEPPPE